MKLIVGLGNPGRLYKYSRHNIGFLVLERLAEDLKISLKKEADAYSSSGKGKIGGNEVILAEPLTFMNLSGSAVKALFKKYKIDLKDILVICDDMDLELGRLKIKQAGSSAGQRGLKSIIYSLGSNNFNRLRIGIGRPKENQDAKEYVLSSFSKAEKKTVEFIIDEACACASAWANEGITEAMNKFNKRRSDD